MQLGSELSFDRLLVVGDTHSDTGWLRDVVLPSAAEMGVPGVAVVGDFGYWPESQTFLRIAREALSTHGITVLFLDGNHEDYSLLKRDVEEFGSSLDKSREPVWMGGGLIYLPRGSKIMVGGIEVVAFGGAASINRAHLVPGVSWFAEELISDDDIAFAQPGGVLLSHDAPSGWVVPNKPPSWGIIQEWIDELAHCEAQRDRLRSVFEVVRPELVIHGHYHSGYHTTVEEAWGEVEVVGLNRNSRPGWGVVLESRDGRPAVDTTPALLADTRPWSLR